MPSYSQQIGLHIYRSSNFSLLHCHQILLVHILDLVLCIELFRPHCDYIPKKALPLAIQVNLITPFYSHYTPLKFCAKLLLTYPPFYKLCYNQNILNSQFIYIVTKKALCLKSFLNFILLNVDQQYFLPHHIY